MTRSAPAATTIDSIRHSLGGLRMPRGLEVLDATLRRIEQGEIDGIGALDEILAEDLILCENRRVKTALLVARLTAIWTCLASVESGLAGGVPFELGGADEAQRRVAPDRIVEAVDGAGQRVARRGP